MTNYKIGISGSQGKRFQGAGFGDLGLRAYREQQDRIIAALKLQNKQDQENTKEYIRDISNNAIKEAQHRKELKALEDDVFDVSMDNTEIRNKREIERLEMKAKEAGKASAFWSDFSTTYSKQYAQAAGQLYQTAQNIQADNQIETLKTDHADVYEQIVEESSVLNTLWGVDALEEKINILRDKNLTDEERYSGIKHVEEIELRLNSTAKVRLVNELLGKWGSIEESLKAQAADRDIPWNSDTINDLYELRSKELLRKLNISPTSKAGKKLLDGVQSKLYPELEKLVAADNQNSDLEISKTYQKNGIGYIGNPEDKNDWIVNLNSHTVHVDRSHHVDEDGKVSAPPSRSNLNAAHDLLMHQYVNAGAFKTIDQAREYLINVATPDKVRDAVAQTMSPLSNSKKLPKHAYWGGRYEDKIDKLDLIWTEYKDKSNKDATKKLETNDTSNLLELTKRAGLPEGDENRFDITNTAQVSETLQLNRGNEKTTKWLSESQVFKFNDNKNFGIISQNIEDLYTEGKVEQLQKYIQFFPEDLQKNWENRIQNLAELENGKMGSAAITKSAESAVSMIIKTDINSIDKYVHPTSAQIVEVVKQDFRNTYQSISEADTENKKDTFTRINEAWTEVLDKLEKGEGPYRRVDDTEGATTQWALFTSEKDETGLSKNYLDEQVLNKPEVGIENFIRNIETNEGKFNGESVLPLDTIDNLIHSDLHNNNINSIDSFDHLYENQPNFGKSGQKYKTREALYNKIFEAMGLNIVIPPGDLSHSRDIVKNSNINVSNYDRYSTNNQMNIAIAAKLSELNGSPVISKTLNPNSPEYFQTKQNRLYNYRYHV